MTKDGRGGMCPLDRPVKRLKIGEKMGKLSNFMPPLFERNLTNTMKNSAVTNNYVIGYLPTHKLLR